MSRSTQSVTPTATPAAAAVALPKNNNKHMTDDIPEKILWSAILRGETILAEAGDELFDGSVSQTARQLLDRKATAGWEFQTLRNNKASIHHRLKGIKFHLHDHFVNEFGGVEAVIWVYAAVYDPNQIDRSSVQSFIDKIMTITEGFRETDEWKYGATLACQASFAPILQQRMQEVTYLGKMALLEDKLESSKWLMQQNIEHILEREEKLNELNDRGTRLNEMAHVFKKKSKFLRRRQMMQNAKHGLILGTAVTAGVALIVVPPLIAIL